jgi:hypothetical protein
MNGYQQPFTKLTIKRKPMRGIKPQKIREAFSYYKSPYGYTERYCWNYKGFYSNYIKERKSYYYA